MDNSGGGHIRWDTRGRTINAEVWRNFAARLGSGAGALPVREALRTRCWTAKPAVINSCDEAQVLKYKLNATMR